MLKFKYHQYIMDFESIQTVEIRRQTADCHPHVVGYHSSA